MTRPANEALCDAFRDLLTTGFYTTDVDGEVHDAQDDPQLVEDLRATKAWRGQVWKAFKEMEDRLCPVRKFERSGLP